MPTLFGWLHCWRAQRVAAKIQREAETRRREEEREQLLCGDTFRKSLDFFLGQFALREGKAALYIEREILLEGITERIMKNAKEDIAARIKSREIVL